MQGPHADKNNIYDYVNAATTTTNNNNNNTNNTHNKHINISISNRNGSLDSPRCRGRMSASTHRTAMSSAFVSLVVSLLSSVLLCTMYYVLLSLIYNSMMIIMILNDNTNDRRCRAPCRVYYY